MPRLLPVAGIVLLFVSACAGKPSVSEQYAKRTQDINEKYDAMLVKADAPLVGAHSHTCGEFIEKLKSGYKYWKAGTVGDDFCATRPSGARLRDFELHVRAVHNKGVALGRAKRLAHLKQLYEEARKTDKGGDDAPPAKAAKGKPVQPPPPSSDDTGGNDFDFATMPVEDAPAPRPAKAQAPPRDELDQEPLETTRAGLRGQPSRPAPTPAPTVKAVDPNDPDQLPYAEDADPPAPAVKAPPRAAPAGKLEPIHPPPSSEYNEGSGSDSNVMEYQ